jgi:protein-disulfide isomerase
MNESKKATGPWLMAAAGIGCALAGGLAGWVWTSGSGGGLAGSDKAAVEKTVHDYILANPEILPKAMEELRKREDAKQLSGVQDDIEQPFPGAVLGNPEGKITLVEFVDFACGYCRQSEADLDALIAANRDLKVVIRQLPILAPESEDAARMGLAAARQGKYAQFHKAMFAAGRPDSATITAAAGAAGLDMALARASLADPGVAAEIESNAQYARQLDFRGTPSWVIGDEIHAGAVGRERLQQSIDKLRG